MKLEITHITSSAAKDKETLIVSAIARHVGEIELSIGKLDIIELLDEATGKGVLTAEDLECVLSRIRRGGRTFHKQSTK